MRRTLWGSSCCPALRAGTDGNEAYCQGCGADQASTKLGEVMADKSPRQHLTKKAGRSLKEKRADKQAKAERSNKIEIVPTDKKR